MDTIAINSGEALNEDGQAKKKINISDTAKAAMATGVAGIAAGVAAKSMADSFEEDTAKETAAAPEAHSAQPEEIATEPEPVEAVEAEVNPDDVMLEEPVAELSSETDMIAEAVPQSSENDEYRPFASNDNISDDVLPEPQPDEVLIAENADEDVIAGEDPSVDLICGMPETEQEIVDEQVAPDGELYADNGSGYDDSDIQSDLMA
ncbi:MAG: hypothetical protein HDS79_05610 [Bacteroidales bacterium]|nr:hypothetical protein [Bacteroidales bacterium]